MTLFESRPVRAAVSQARTINMGTSQPIDPRAITRPSVTVQPRH